MLETVYTLRQAVPSIGYYQPVEWECGHSHVTADTIATYWPTRRAPHERALHPTAVCTQYSRRAAPAHACRSLCTIYRSLRVCIAAGATGQMERAPARLEGFALPHALRPIRMQPLLHLTPLLSCRSRCGVARKGVEPLRRLTPRVMALVHGRHLGLQSVQPMSIPDGATAADGGAADGGAADGGAADGGAPPLLA